MVVFVGRSVFIMLFRSERRKVHVRLVEADL